MAIQSHLFPYGALIRVGGFGEDVERTFSEAAVIFFGGEDEIWIGLRYDGDAREENKIFPLLVVQKTTFFGYV